MADALSMCVEATAAQTDSLRHDKAGDRLGGESVPDRRTTQLLLTPADTRPDAVTKFASAGNQVVS